MWKTGPPHFLHLAGTVIGTYSTINSCDAGYKEETRLGVLVSQSPQNGVIFDGLPRT
jgi:hypothetical protein